MFVCALIATGVLIGGYTRISHQSGVYDSSLNRSFATQGSVLVDESNITAASVRYLMATMQYQHRPALQADLDNVVQQTGLQAARAVVLADSVSPGDIQGKFAAVLSNRALAMSRLRAAIDGLLGMHPLLVAGAPEERGTRAATPTLLSSTEVTERIAAIGALLTRSDQSYLAVRRSLADLAGHARLPTSTWVRSAHVWQVSSLATQVALVESSPSLAVTHDVVLSAVELSPQALPSTTGLATPGLSVLSPTTKVAVTVVLSNLGSVDESHASVQFTLTPQPTGVTTTVTRNTAVASGRSVTLSPASFAVKPGHSYQLTVVIVDPAAQTSSRTTVLQIAPAT